MTRSAYVLLITTLCLSIAADAGAQRPPRASGDVSEVSIRSHLEFLAGDALNGRGSGTRDEWIAATYIASMLRRWGIEPLGDDGGYVQRVDIERAEVTSAPVLSFGSTRWTHGKEILVQALTSATLTGPLVRFDPSVPSAPGAIVLLPDPAPASLANVASAAAVLVAETTQIRTRWETSGSRMPPMAARIVGTTGPGRPSTIVLDKASHAALSAAAPGTSITIAAPVKPLPVTHTWNAAGRITGRDKTRASEVILLTAHLDHIGNRARENAPPTEDTIFNGADDDASGSVAVLELAEALSKGRRPKRTVIFTWFGSEESGGFGAGYFLERPPVPLAKIVANLEFEMIGRPDQAVAPHTLWLTGYERSNLGPELARHGARLVQDPHPAQNFFARSDNILLARRGVIAQTVSSFGLHKEYHQPSDEIKMIDFAHMTEAIRSMLKPVKWLANSSFVPAWAPGKKP